MCVCAWDATVGCNGRVCITFCTRQSKDFLFFVCTFRAFFLLFVSRARYVGFGRIWGFFIHLDASRL